MSRILADYHMHTLFSPDGHCSPEEMCRAALDKGLTEIAVTDHFEFFTDGIFEDAKYRVETIAACYRELDVCRETFAGRLKIRSGIEIGQPQTAPDDAAKVMAALPLDYVIGSVHKLKDIDLGLVDYPDEIIPGRVRENLAMLYELADRYDYDCLGHLDIVKRYAAVHGKKIDLMDYRDGLEPVLRRAAERGKGIELNTSGARQAAKEALPSTAVLKLYRSLGGEILTVGSDAHYARDVAADFNIAREMALEAGFRYLAVYEKRVPEFYSIV